MIALDGTVLHLILVHEDEGNEPELEADSGSCEYPAAGAN